MDAVMESARIDPILSGDASSGIERVLFPILICKINTLCLGKLYWLTEYSIGH